MLQIEQTERFRKWLRTLRDRFARMRILARIDRLMAGHAGDFRDLGDGVRELRIDYGGGYRVYYTHRNKEVVLLIAGGIKKSQSRDIETAKRIAREMRGE